jgi:hypothetical protein
MTVGKVIQDSMGDPLGDPLADPLEGHNLLPPTEGEEEEESATLRSPSGRLAALQSNAAEDGAATVVEDWSWVVGMCERISQTSGCRPGLSPDLNGLAEAMVGARMKKPDTWSDEMLEAYMTDVVGRAKSNPNALLAKDLRERLSEHTQATAEMVKAETGRKAWATRRKNAEKRKADQASRPRPEPVDQRSVLADLNVRVIAEVEAVRCRGDLSWYRFASKVWQEIDGGGGPDDERPIPVLDVPQLSDEQVAQWLRALYVVAGPNWLYLDHRPTEVQRSW